MMAEGGLSTEDVLSPISSENNEEISNEQALNWLSMTCGADILTEFEQNEENLTEIKHRMEQHSIRQRDYKIIVEQMKTETKEYKADRERMSRILTSINLPGSLSMQASLHLQNLQKIGEVLELSNPDRVNMTIGISDLFQEREDTEEMYQEIQRRIEVYNLGIQDVKKEKWQKLLEDFNSRLENEKANFSKIHKSMAFNEQKRAQYTAKIKSAEDLLEQAGYETSLSHKELVKMGDELKEIENTLGPMKQELGSYKDLPPDYDRARIKLEEKKLEMVQIQQELTKKLEDVSLAFPSTKNCFSEENKEDNLT